jgi:peptidoglycan-N-acetylglucosamine deacetylase
LVREHQYSITPLYTSHRPLPGVNLKFIIDWAGVVFLSLGLLFLSGCQGGYFKGQTEEKVVALTFDDGPHPVYTPQVLDILDRFNVGATFFLIGSQAQAHPDQVRRIRERGHALGNHSFHHPFYLSWLSPEEIRAEILETQEVIHRIGGEYPRYFRPPLGWVSNDLVAVCRELNLPVINGSVKAGDVSRPGTERIIETVLADVESGDIIILHDAGGVEGYRDRGQTIEALPIIIERLKYSGYKFVFLDELIYLTRKDR